MTWLHNMLSTLIAFLMAVVLAHFGAHGETQRPAKSIPTSQHNNTGDKDSDN